LPFISVIESLLVNEESEKFNGRLSSIGLSSGHVDIIDEDSNLLARLSTEQSTLLLLKLAFDSLLSSQ